MNKSNEAKFRNRFPQLRWSSLVLFRNVGEFGSMYIERINPDHRGIVWGRRRKELKKGTAYIKVGEIYFMSIFIAYVLSQIAFVDYLTGYVLNLLVNTSLIGFCVVFILSVMLYYVPIKMEEAWVSRSSSTLQ